jgi:hypothetical protein
VKQLLVSSTQGSGFKWGVREKAASLFADSTLKLGLRSARNADMLLLLFNDDTESEQQQRNSEM